MLRKGRGGGRGRGLRATGKIDEAADGIVVSGWVHGITLKEGGRLEGIVVWEGETLGRERVLR